ncbi:hypothetical protein EVAR_51994_1 [Eumeta japonica]|uniref:Uncharacterized protein n=1 Tax=Eumeta variegata TaxID=151549 RepID=A0A4C1XYG7_EUMVA|nr:hypothetical protein EVAR_51994_1 [Eumeta japonica]
MAFDVTLRPLSESFVGPLLQYPTLYQRTSLSIPYLIPTQEVGNQCVVDKRNGDSSERNFVCKPPPLISGGVKIEKKKPGQKQAMRYLWNIRSGAKAFVQLTCCS